MPDVLRILQEHIEILRRQLSLAEIKRIYNISIPHLALLLLFNERPFIAIEDSEENASRLYNDFLFFSSVLQHPHSVALLRPPSSPEFIGERAKALHSFKTGKISSLITSKEACASGPDISDIQGSILLIKKGMELGRDYIEKWLKDNGYRSASIVMEKGEYSRRQWVFDIYPSVGELPVRLEFFGDEIEIIRTFDIETQRSVKEMDSIEIFPAVEPVSEKETGRSLIEELSKLRNLALFSVSDISGLEPDSIVSVSHLPFAGEGLASPELSIKGLGILPEERKGIEDIAVFFKNAGKNITAVMSSQAQADRLHEILSQGDVIAPLIALNNLKTYDGKYCITLGRLSSGINLPGLLFLTDKEIFGDMSSYRSIKRTKVSRLLLSIEELNAGDFVVHKDHGIGRFMGLQRQKFEDFEEDLIALQYANGMLYVPFHGIGRLQKYSAAEGQSPPLDRIGGRTWYRTKQKVKKGIYEMAEKLLKLYAERRVSRGFVFSNDTHMHREFDDFFPYEETPDQIKATEVIKKHMTSEEPMDILLCGDVGYGKTEVAIKAAFRAAYDGKQTAVLVPTTLLAEQHFRTFKARFSGFPINIDYVSRFKSKSDIEETIRRIANGETDIIIGTHILLNKEVRFHDLGLLIIDEEHRFGVAQKERLKELRKGVDILTLTATPIPRTLQMALSGIRDMCVIETPPEERLAVRSVVAVFKDSIIKDAIERELKRGGQVFFVHNRVNTLERAAAHIQRLVPSAHIAVAHGRMREADLEKIMLAFLNRETNVLVCTAIIGSGLDITTANTIIVDRADTFGLSDLYQLRGRVGRGNLQAYAYFLIPGEALISDDAKKRLQAIQEMSYLGAGFRLALKDLEIRGAGNLLGPEQSGHIYKVGFDMYMDMLEKAVAELKGQEAREEVEPQIRLRISAFIPEEYISDISVRLNIYKRLASAKNLDDLSAMKDELLDRFGRIPPEVENLLHMMRIKLLARRLYIERVHDIDGRYRFYFVRDAENKYGIPNDFFDKLLKALFVLQKKERAFRFFPDGFELGAGSASIRRVEAVLSALCKAMDNS